MRVLLLGCACILSAYTINAATIHVPADQPTIQAGIDAAVNGDTVLVASGTYSGVGNVDIQLKGKPILVKSESGHRLTIIDCQGIGRGFTFTDNEDTLTVIEGFRVYNGYGWGGGAWGGGAVACVNSSPIIRGCLFKGNNGGTAGGAVCCHDASPILQDCVMDDNYVIDWTEGPFGGSLACLGESHPELRNCNLLVNSYDGPWLRGYDIACSENSTVVLKRCILMGDIECSDPGECAWVECSDILGGGALATINQNFTADPMFCDTANDDYHIQSTSPCHPDSSACGLIGALGVGCYGNLVSMFGIENELSLLNVVNHMPTFFWSYNRLDGFLQTAFEIAVGTDNDWTFAEMWSPPVFNSTDTFVTYDGAPLQDGETYYVRLRLHDGTNWCDWYYDSFRMNSIPSIPVPLNPIDDVIIGTTPALWIDNSTDAEGDALTYDFLVDVDTLYGEPDPVTGYGIPEGEDSTGWQVTETLDENKRYVWIVRAFDGYEYSDWTGGYEYTFFVNGTPEPPTAPQAQFPPDTGGTPVWDMLTYFYWAPSTDPDPLDTVRYKLEIAVDSTFTFVNTIDSIESVPFTLNDSLQFGTRYWWRVTAFDKTGLSTLSPNTPDFWTWTLGDVDYSHDVSVGDLTYLVAYLFQGGQAIYPLFIGDVDGSCTVDVGDLTYLVVYLFQSGPAPKVGCA